jgi:uncharacterized membrane protein
MENFMYFGLARAIHVVGVVLWIGGVAFVTTALIPSLRKMTDTDDRLALFEQLEGKFAFQARIVTLITGLSGFYMLEYMDAWERYQHIHFWWIHLMTLIWLIFTLVLFVLEPLVLHRRFRALAAENSDRAFALIHRMHRILLVLSLITVLGTVAGVLKNTLCPIRICTASGFTFRPIRLQT